MIDQIKLNTVLLAKEFHPERQRGGSGVAVVIREPDMKGSFISIEWIDSKVNPHCPEDVASIQHLSKCFNIIDENLRDKYVPKDWKSKGIVEKLLNNRPNLKMK